MLVLTTVLAHAAPGPRVLLQNAADPDVYMPVAGLGTDFASCENASASGNQSFAPALQWLQLGGRRFDGALSYGCDFGVGQAIRASGLARSEVFVASKIGPGGLPLPLGFTTSRPAPWHRRASAHPSRDC